MPDLFVEGVWVWVIKVKDKKSTLGKDEFNNIFNAYWTKRAPLWKAFCEWLRTHKKSKTKAVECQTVEPWPRSKKTLAKSMQTDEDERLKKLQKEIANLKSRPAEVQPTDDSEYKTQLEAMESRLIKWERECDNARQEAGALEDALRLFETANADAWQAFEEEAVKDGKLQEQRDAQRVEDRQLRDENRRLGDRVKGEEGEIGALKKALQDAEAANYQTLEEMATVVQDNTKLQERALGGMEDMKAEAQRYKAEMKGMQEWLDQKDPYWHIEIGVPEHSVQYRRQGLWPICERNGLADQIEAAYAAKGKHDASEQVRLKSGEDAEQANIWLLEGILLELKVLTEEETAEVLRAAEALESECKLQDEIKQRAKEAHNLAEEQANFLADECAQQAEICESRARVLAEEAVSWQDALNRETAARDALQDRLRAEQEWRAEVAALEQRARAAKELIAAAEQKQNTEAAEKNIREAEQRLKEEEERAKQKWKEERWKEEEDRSRQRCKDEENLARQKWKEEEDSAKQRWKDEEDLAKQRWKEEDDRAKRALEQWAERAEKLAEGDIGLEDEIASLLKAQKALKEEEQRAKRDGRRGRLQAAAHFTAAGKHKMADAEVLAVEMQEDKETVAAPSTAHVEVMAATSTAHVEVMAVPLMESKMVQSMALGGGANKALGAFQDALRKHQGQPFLEGLVKAELMANEIEAEMAHGMDGFHECADERAEARAHRLKRLEEGEHDGILRETLRITQTSLEVDFEAEIVKREASEQNAAGPLVPKRHPKGPKHDSNPDLHHDPHGELRSNSRLSAVDSGLDQHAHREEIQRLHTEVAQLTKDRQMLQNAVRDLTKMNQEGTGRRP
eukprot:gnl/MRDRNA2_/MRDRNA2_51596_c0_seq2.p1 gnl/MRDRNA2_/MRDRNA2_51596_c0~~gnl/MRDRNA2_/MRDRNA2_51596_c0_seq2.p1  ORF type:complete len:953 (+),score=307.92 gnl/MRDRNA2_/MRDRNA2_51596_c0_seq2:306-2861(+)